ncbi:DUF4148 domain-containing protein [Paraburkholderia terrae]|uniref:DUF4148 domain-containing protein n=1 Tax=Paraburkholderia terrae TaxID=311230 RepID=UPI00296B1F02|nr:DUF4148 domain-containing protein [Paraburkholderia terrae]MDW3661904.1 DUF4148 domain-containing protein [Paraburkholderia terrae]
MVKAFIPFVVLASDLAIPTFAFAHGDGPRTREQMRAEVTQLQQAAYDRTTGATQYPANILVTLKSVAAQQQAFANYPAA